MSSRVYTLDQSWDKNVIFFLMSKYDNLHKLYIKYFTQGNLDMKVKTSLKLKVHLAHYI